MPAVVVHAKQRLNAILLLHLVDARNVRNAKNARNVAKNPRNAKNAENAKNVARNPRNANVVAIVIQCIQWAVVSVVAPVDQVRRIL